MFGGTAPRNLNLGLGRRCVALFTCQNFMLSMFGEQSLLPVEQGVACISELLVYTLRRISYLPN
jgi:hypothetical protein